MPADLGVIAADGDEDHTLIVPAVAGIDHRGVRPLLDLLGLLSYEIDFPDEDDGPVAPERLQGQLDQTRARIDALLSTAPEGDLLVTLCVRPLGTS